MEFSKQIQKGEEEAKKKEYNQRGIFDYILYIFEYI